MNRFLTFECIYFVSEILHTYDIVTISSDREKDSDAHKEEIRTYEDRLENTRQQLLGERNKNLKKTNKEVAEVKYRDKKASVEKKIYDARHCKFVMYQVTDVRDNTLKNDPYQYVKV